MAVHYMNTPIRYVVDENFGGFFYDHDDVSLAEVLQDQEIMYESFQSTGRANTGRTISNGNLQSGPRHRQNLRERSASKSVHVNTQLATDEAIAKELQDLENQLIGVSFDATNSTHSERPAGTAGTSNLRSARAPRAVQAPRDDGIDPDNMTYEELQELGETIGTANRGLSNELIARLPISTYKIGGIFSRKEKHDECVICCMKYENKEKLITLPCTHKYHKTCVTKWLEINKTCPVCGKEVFGS